MKTIYCYGDSNTWGFDPRGWPDCRYEAENRWCDLLAEKTGCRVLNGGFNGRRVPRHPSEYTALGRSMMDAGVLDLMIILLGTNDILGGRTPEETAGDMEQLLRQLRRDFPGLPLLLLSPPRCGRAAPEPYNAFLQLEGLYKSLAARYCTGFLSLGDLPLSFDGVHLSGEGHLRLRDLLALYLGQQGFFR